MDMTDFDLLAGFTLDIAPHATLSVGEFLADFARDGIEGYVCGGAVRDVLQGQPFNDVDFVFKLAIEELDTRLQRRFGADAVTFRSYSFGLVKLGADQAVDVTMLRSADSVGDATLFNKVHYALGDSLLDDARNRDLSINALYWSPAAGVVDPLGHAVDDVRNRLLRVVADPRKAAIDPRITFRLLAFMARGYTLSDSAADYLRTWFDRDVARYGKASLASYMPTLTRGNTAAARLICDSARAFGSDATCARLDAAALSMQAA